MCGISGIILKKKNINIITYCKLLIKYLHNRGIDDNNFFINNIGNIGLCHNRLSIIDLDKRSKQPFFFKNLVMIFNGEIYNYIELKNILIDKYNAEFLSTSDTEVLIQLFYYEGIENCLNKLNGIFSIALYDTNTNNIYLIRDRIGIKYLYYYNDNDKFIFASNPASIVKTLYDIENKKWEIDSNSLFSYISGGICLSKKTLFKEIYGLDSGNIITLNISINNIQINKWWEPNFNRENDDLEYYIKNSIKLQERGDVPKAILFSGGIDSSILGYYSNESKLITMDFGELEYSKKFCELNSKNDKLIIIDNNFLDDKLLIFIEEQRKIINFSGIPTKASYIMTMSSLYMKNNMKDTKILLCGIGGNELFYGHRRIKFNNDTFDNHLKDLYIFLTQIKQLDNKYGEELIEFKKLFNENIRKEIEIPDNLNKVNTPRWLEYKTFLLNDLLLNADSIYMYYSIEARVPLLDHNIFEICLSKTPNDFFYDYNDIKNNPTWNLYTANSKKPLKDILKKILPENYIKKEKYSYDVERHKIHPLYLTLCNNFFKRNIIGWNGILTKYNSHLIGNIELWLQEFEYLLKI